MSTTETTYDCIEQHGWMLLMDDYEIVEWTNDDYDVIGDETTIRHVLDINMSNTHEDIIVQVGIEYYHDDEHSTEYLDTQMLDETAVETFDEAVDVATVFAQDYAETDAELAER